ncbi:hypothetical protein BARVI_05070 [Barnesiella viscericola DSM 18177]|uniref:Uncharacterized protein n=1 Tax=Barnesiella viscericola DSM 18177 TaxID=880074 RepID=W0EW21_9BACT|nr:hypothetical protein BARVI_05070 [Barnesiella viscericola DSM 18177]
MHNDRKFFTKGQIFSAGLILTGLTPARDEQKEFGIRYPFSKRNPLEPKKRERL